MPHHGLEAVLCVQIPPLHKSILGAVQQQKTHYVSNTVVTKTCFEQFEAYSDVFTDISGNLPFPRLKIPIISTVYHRLNSVSINATHSRIGQAVVSSTDEFLKCMSVKLRNTHRIMCLFLI